jgi:hypothetical protein
MLVDALFLRLAWSRLISTKRSVCRAVGGGSGSQIRKIVEQHVAAHLPAKTLAKLRDLHARNSYRL